MFLCFGCRFLVVFLTGVILIFRYICQFRGFFDLLSENYPKSVSEYLALEATGALNYESSKGRGKSPSYWLIAITVQVEEFDK